MQIDLNDFSFFSNAETALRMVTANIVLRLAEVGLDPTTLMLWGPSLVISSLVFTRIMSLSNRLAEEIAKRRGPRSVRSATCSLDRAITRKRPL